MLTEKPADATHPATHVPGTPVDLDRLIAYFQGDYVPLAEATVSIMTHAFMYGTAVFEGIRAYWNEDEGQLYALKVREHAQRILANASMLLMDPLPTVEQLSATILETARRNGFHEDIYIRPSFYKSTRSIGVKLHHLDHELYVIATPFGNYIDVDAGVRVMTSSWRRNPDEALPARGKIVGGYVNMAFQKSEAELNGYDEALVMSLDGHASEASAANLFIVRDGLILTPGLNDDILEGVTRAALIQIAGDLGYPVEVRSIDRSEIYVSDEVFLCGTGVQVSPVVEVDHRRVGDGKVGPIARRIQEVYFDAARGRLPQYRDWVTPVY
ncbi:MAG TPA: branched-chain amino acid transaminase [Candidatus Limnocylindrales bacterium]